MLTFQDGSPDKVFVTIIRRQVAANVFSEIYKSIHELIHVSWSIVHGAWFMFMVHGSENLKKTNLNRDTGVAPEMLGQEKTTGGAPESSAPLRKLATVQPKVCSSALCQNSRAKLLKEKLKTPR